MKKRLLILTLIICMIASAVPVFGASFDSFADAKGHWAQSSLERAVSENILNGSNGYLYPNGSLKGSEMSAIMVRQLDLQTYKEAYPGTVEKDWFYRYAAIAAHAGIIPTDEPLDMEAQVTREQVFMVFAEAYFTDAEFDAMVKKQAIEAEKRAEELKKQEEEKAKAEAEALKKQEEEKAKAEAEALKKQEEEKAKAEAEGATADSDETVQPDAAVLDNNAGKDNSENKAQDATENEQVTADVDQPAAENTEENTEEKPEEPVKPEGFLGFGDIDQLSAEGMAAAELLYDAGLVKGDDIGCLNPQKQITRAEFVTMLFRAADSKKAVVSDKGLKITLDAPDVKPGAMVKADAEFNGVSGALACDVQWYFDGAAREGFSASGKSIKNGDKSSFSTNIEFTRKMNLFRRVGLEISYTENGDAVHKYAEKVVTIENYPPSHYWESLYQEALNTVSCVYKGNYTSSYNIDYSTEIKEAFINGKGYSSKTGYLAWINLATQKVNVFVGEKGDWELIKTFRCASGSRSTPTPTGVTYVTYKQNGWYTDKYICRPIVRFYPGTGYAFHSVLFHPNGSGRIIDGSMGFPVSHGCIRMMPPDINWMHANIPLNTTVVIY